MPVAPKDVTSESNAIPPAMPIDSVNLPVTPVTPEASTAVPPMQPDTSVPLITPAPTIPTADNSLLDKAVAAINTSTVDEFASLFDSGSFQFITLKGDKVTSIPELKVQWGAMFGTTGTLKGAKATLTPGKVIELASGAAAYDGSIVFTTADNKTVRALITGTMKYSEPAWKISTMHLSSNDLVKMQEEAEFQKNKSGSSGTLVALLLGFVLGAVAIIYYKSRRPKQAQ
jgi:hypothetical protein